LREQPDRTLAELQKGLQQSLGISFSNQHLWRVLKRLNVRLKKVTSCRRARHRSQSKQRAEFLEKIHATPLDKLIFLDESGVTTSMTRLYARCPGARASTKQRPAATGKS